MYGCFAGIQISCVFREGPVDSTAYNAAHTATRCNTTQPTATPLQHQGNTTATQLQHRFCALFAKDPRIWLTPHLLQHATTQCNPAVTPLQHHRNTTCNTDFARSSQGPCGFDWLTSCWQNCFYWWSRTSADYQIGCAHGGCGQSHVSCSWGNFHTCIHVYMYSCIYSYMYIYTYIYIYVYEYT